MTKRPAREQRDILAGGSGPIPLSGGALSGYGGPWDAVHLGLFGASDR